MAKTDCSINLQKCLIFLFEISIDNQDLTKQCPMLLGLISSLKSRPRSSFLIEPHLGKALLNNRGPMAKRKTFHLDFGL